MECLKWDEVTRILPAINGYIITGAEFEGSSHISNHKKRILEIYILNGLNPKG